MGAERLDNGSLSLRVSTAAINYDFRTYSTKKFGEIDQLLNNKTNFDPRTAHSPVVQSCGSCWQTHLESDLSQYGGDYCLSRRIYAFLQPTRQITRGTLLTNINLSTIGKFLQNLRIGETGQVFIIERSGMLVATSIGERLFHVVKKDYGAERVKAIDSKNK